MSQFSTKSASEGERRLPDCWGHRGASAAYPENSLASFEKAMRDGSEGIESDVHVSLDNVVMMFHDQSLDRTTDMEGLIREKNWYGPDGMEHARTKKEPKQAIPTFAETVALLMKEENRHVLINVDVKVFNDPTRLFPLMHTIISSYDNWETLLAPRIILGLWHPKFIEPAKTLIPYCCRAHIGLSPYVAREYFWQGCDAFSMGFAALQTWEGERFRKECKAAGKKLMVWTVNDPRQMMECIRWEVDAIITDVTKSYLSMRSSVEVDYAKVDSEYGRLFLWTNMHYYTPLQLVTWRKLTLAMEKFGGPFTSLNSPVSSLPAASTAVTA
ncbi:PLC-like phosphodiesterase [Phellopilus nigrolimitatus]|nr:PLC-like phosphodiesterase [Phellopilus nigrolimitatus]